MHAIAVTPPLPQVKCVMVMESGSSLNVSWTGIANISMNKLSYIVRYSTNSSNETDPPSDATKKLGIMVTSTTLTGLQSNTIYVWVAAETLDSGIQGPYSRRVSLNKGKVI